MLRRPQSRARTRRRESVVSDDGRDRGRRYLLPVSARRRRRRRRASGRDRGRGGGEGGRRCCRGEDGELSRVVQRRRLELPSHRRRDDGRRARRPLRRRRCYGRGRRRRKSPGPSVVALALVAACAQWPLLRRRRRTLPVSVLAALRPEDSGRGQVKLLADVVEEPVAQGCGGGRGGGRGVGLPTVFVNGISRRRRRRRPSNECCVVAFLCSSSNEVARQGDRRCRVLFVALHLSAARREDARRERGRNSEECASSSERASERVFLF